MHFKSQYKWSVACVFIIFHSSLSSIPSREQSMYENSEDKDELKTSGRGLLPIFTQRQSLNIDCPLPPDLPPFIRLRRLKLEEADPINSPMPWVATPISDVDIMVLANWALFNEYTIQSLDLARSPSPFSILRKVNCSSVLLLDTEEYLNKMKLVDSSLLTVETGASILDVLEFLEHNNAGLTVVPIGGELTVGEALAFGAVGIGVKSINEEQPLPFASFSSMVMSFKAVLWDHSLEVYTIKRIDRDDLRSIGLLTHLGRSVITEVTILVEPSYKLRCQTFSNFLPENLFASPNTVNLKSHTTQHETLSQLINEMEKVELTYFPYVDRTWVKLWTKEWKRPLGSLGVSSTFRSQLKSFVPLPTQIKTMTTGLQYLFPSMTPHVSRLEFDLGALRLRLSGADDIWGSSQNIFYTSRNNSRVHGGSGYAVITANSRVQQVVHQFYERFTRLMSQFRERNSYPINEPITLKVSRLDSTLRINDKLKLYPPALSVLAPVNDRPELDVALIIGIPSLSKVPDAREFINVLEYKILKTLDEDFSIVRPLWGTEWAHSLKSPWDNNSIMKQFIPAAYDSGWNKAIKILDYYDPHKIFSTPFSREFLSSYDPNF